MASSPSSSVGHRPHQDGADVGSSPAGGGAEPSSPANYERSYVHDVYDTIAPHFSATRFKAWPRIRDFLESLPPHALVADVGCGNGKYFASAQRRREGGDGLTVPGRRFVLGMDFSLPLLRLTQRTVADPNFDPQTTTATTASSTAAAGEETTAAAARKRHRGDGREAETTAMPRTDVLRCDGRRCPLRPGSFDVAISIAVVHHYATPARRQEAIAELLRLVRPDGGRVLVYVWALEGNEKKPKFSSALDRDTGDALVRWEVNARFDEQRRTFQRYYHLFREGELTELCVAAAEGLGTSIRVVESYFDRENWCVLVERQPSADKKQKREE